MGRFWITQGFWIRRLPDDEIELGKMDESIVIFDMDSWCSAVASTSLKGETKETFEAIYELLNPE